MAPLFLSDLHHDERTALGPRGFADGERDLARCACPFFHFSVPRPLEMLSVNAEPQRGS